MTRPALVVLLAAIAGCSLPRSAIGAPGDVAQLDGGGIDVGPIEDVGPDTADHDAYPDDSGEDAFVDVDAFTEIDANVDASATPDAACTVGTTSCVAGEVWACDVDGTQRWRSTCPLGCSTMPSPHCIDLHASHVVDAVLLPSGSAPLMVASGQTVQIDGATGAITLLPMTLIRAAGVGAGTGGMIGYATQAQASGPDLAIFSFSTIQVASGGTLSLIGPRAVVLLASGNVTIDGVVDASASGTAAGAGGFDGGSHRADGSGPSGGHRGDVVSSNLMSGGGGGGHAGTGGRGGNEDAFCCGPDSQGGAGGAPSADADLAILLGGSGGAGGGDGTSGGVGGGGGGALQITSRTMMRISGSGIVRAVGAGGGPGHEAGGGGGGGGTVFLEAMTITVDGVVTTNGGAGGGGGSSGGTGGRGTDSLTAAAPGGGSSGGAPGGAGSASAVLDGSAASEGDGGGGGGGAGGRIRFVTQSGMRIATGIVTPAGGVTEARASIY